MQWSKLKVRIKERICPELRDRIGFHLTSYRKSHDGADKVWITIDGERVFSCKYYPYLFGENELVSSLKLSLEEAKLVLNEIEIHEPKDFGRAMRTYLDMPIEEASRSADPFIKAFAIVDRRAGKRTFQKMEISDSDHTLVRAFYDLRK